MYGVNEQMMSLPKVDLLNLYDTNQLDFEFDKRFTANYRVGKEKEFGLCDVKIVDWIYENIHKHKMFLTQDHPTSIVFS